jgi:uncharacterized protein YutE (UPF0331/DUF86 family)
MDQRIIEEKLESLRRCVRRIETKRPRRVEVLQDDWDLQDIIALNMTRAVQLCVDIAAHVVAVSDQAPPETMGEAFEHLHEMGVLDYDLSERLKGAVGFRNIAVHNYRTIDWQIVFSIIHDHLDDFRQYAKAIDSWFTRSI